MRSHVMEMMQSPLSTLELPHTRQASAAQLSMKGTHNMSLRSSSQQSNTTRGANSLDLEDVPLVDAPEHLRALGRLKAAE